MAPAAPIDRPLRVRVVLGSGGIKPVAGVPLLEFLEREGVAADELAGCSGGGVVAALYGLGLRGREVRRVIVELLQPHLFTDIDPMAPWRAVELLLGRRSPNGMLRSDRMRDVYREVFDGARIETLPRRVVLQATKFADRQGVALCAGSLADALYASTAAYPLFPPIRIGGEWLMDGAFSAPLPLQGSGAPAALTLAVSSNPPGVRSVTDRLLRLPDEPSDGEPCAANDESRNGYLLLRPSMQPGVRWRDTHLIPDLFAAGERAVAQQAPAIRAALDACLA